MLSMVAKIKRISIEKAQYYLTFLLIFLFFSATFFSIFSYYKIDIFMLLTSCSFALFLTLFASSKPVSIILAGHKITSVSNEVSVKLQDIIKSYSDSENTSIKIIIVDDLQANVFLVSQPGTDFYICTTSAISMFNKIDFEAIFAYFYSKKQIKPQFIDTIYLLIASVLEKVIILKAFSEVFASMTVTYGERYVFDRKAVERTHNPIGYKNMLTKAKANVMGTKFGKSFSISGVFDTGITSENIVISEIDKRIELVTKA